MTKLDRQHRILIPKELLDSLSFDFSEKVSINYDYENNSLYLDCPNPQTLTCCVAIRQIDQKKRISLSGNILQLINADYSSDFIVYIRYGCIHISKFEKKNPDT